MKLRATLRYGFEWQEFYCLDCLDKGKAWLELPDNLDPESSRALKKMPKGAGIVNLTVVGSFHFGKSYGHLNGYRYQLTAEGVRDIAVLQKGMKDAAIEKKVEEQYACGGTNPK